jgi:hypothetical protein
VREQDDSLPRRAVELFEEATMAVSPWQFWVGGPAGTFSVTLLTRRVWPRRITGLIVVSPDWLGDRGLDHERVRVFLALLGLALAEGAPRGGL